MKTKFKIDKNHVEYDGRSVKLKDPQAALAKLQEKIDAGDFELKETGVSPLSDTDNLTDEMYARASAKPEIKPDVLPRDFESFLNERLVNYTDEGYLKKLEISDVIAIAKEVRVWVIEGTKPTNSIDVKDVIALVEAAKAVVKEVERDSMGILGRPTQIQLEKALKALGSLEGN